MYASVQKRPAETHPVAMVGKPDGQESAGGTITLSSNLTELDNLLAELSSSQFVAADGDHQHQPANCMNAVYSVVLSLCSIVWWLYYLL